MNIGEILRYRRKEKGLTQEELAEGICSVTYISKTENSSIEPKEDILLLLCEKLDISLKDLIVMDTTEVLRKLSEIYFSISKNNSSLEVKNDIKKILDQVKVNSDPLIELAGDITLAQYFIYTGDSDSAKRKLDHASQGMNYLTKEITFCFHNSYGLYEYLYGTNENSLIHYKEALTLANVLNLNVSNLNYQLGLVNSKLMQLNDSLYYTRKAKEYFTEAFNLPRIVDCTILIGINYNRLGEYELALEQFLKLLPVLKEQGSSANLARVHHNLGYIYAVQKNNKSAVQHLESALNYKETDKEKLSSLYVLSYALNSDNKEKALETMDLGIKKSYEINDNYHLYKFKILKYLNSKTTDRDSFIETLENEAIPYYSKFDKTIYGEVVLLLANLYKQKNQYKKSTSYYEMYLAEHKNLLTKELLF